MSFHGDRLSNLRAASLRSSNLLASRVRRNLVITPDPLSPSPSDLDLQWILCCTTNPYLTETLQLVVRPVGPQLSEVVQSAL